MTSRVWRESKQSGGTLLLLMAMADFADDEGICFPAVETLAKKARMTARHVRRVLRELEEKGEIRSQPNAGPHGVNVYKITLGEDKMSGDIGVPSPRTFSASPPDMHVLQTVIDPSIEPSKKEDELTLEAARFVEWFIAELKATGAPEPRVTPGMRTSWAGAYEKMRRIDGRSKEEIVKVCRWARRDPFWSGNFMSPAKLRQKNKDEVFYYDVFLNRITNGHSNVQRSNPRDCEANRSAINAYAEYDKQLAAGGVQHDLAG